MTEHLRRARSPPDQLRRRLDKYLAMTPGRRPDVRDHPRRRGASRPVRWATGRTSRARSRPGWSVLPAFQGRGVATRGTEQCIDLAAAEGGYATIHAYPSVDNAALERALPARSASSSSGRTRFEYPQGPLDDLQRLVARPPRVRRDVDGPVRDLVGERVALGPLRRELFPLHQTWLNDPEVAWNVFGAPVRRVVRGGARLDRAVPRRPATRLWLIYRLDEARPIGVTALTEIDVAPRHRDFRTLSARRAIAARASAREASELVLRHGFEDLGLREIRLDVFGYNAPAIRLYERLGFREVERHPMQLERDGRRWDVIRMARSIRVDLGGVPLARLDEPQEVEARPASGRRR